MSIILFSLKKAHSFLLLLCICISGYFANAQDIAEQKTFEDALEFIKKTRFSDPDLAKPEALTLLAKIENTDKKELIIKVNYELGKIEGALENHQEAITYYDVAIRISKEIQNNYLLVNTFKAKGNQYTSVAKNSEALALYYKGLELAEKRKYYDQIMYANVNIANLKNVVGKHQEALKVIKNALYIAEKHKYDKENAYIDILMILGDTYTKLNRLDSALYYNNRGIKESNIRKDEDALSYFYGNNGIVYYKKRAYKRALNDLYKAEEKIIDLGAEKRLTEIYAYISQCYFDTKNYPKSIEYSKKVISICEENELLRKEANLAYELTSKAYKELGDEKKALVYLNKSVAYNEKIEQADDKVIEELHGNDLKKSEDKTKEVTQKSKRQKVIFLIIIACCIVLIISGLLWYKRLIRTKDKQFQQLIEKIETKKTKVKTENHIKDEKIVMIMNGLEKLIQQQYFLKQECNLYNVAKKLKTNTSYLSKVINTYENKTFNTYLNDIRIDYVLERLQTDPKFRSYSVKAIAEEIGYKRSASFSRYFKEKTGLYLSFYIKKMNELNS